MPGSVRRLALMRAASTPSERASAAACEAGVAGGGAATDCVEARDGSARVAGSSAAARRGPGTRSQPPSTNAASRSRPAARTSPPALVAVRGLLLGSARAIVAAFAAAGGRTAPAAAALAASAAAASFVPASAAFAIAVRLAARRAAASARRASGPGRLVRLVGHDCVLLRVGRLPCTRLKTASNRYATALAPDYAVSTLLPSGNSSPRYANISVRRARLARSSECEQAGTALATVCGLS